MHPALSEAMQVIAFLANGFAAVTFWLIYDAKHQDMARLHRTAYVLFTAGLLVNALQLFSGSKEEVGLGEMMSSVGFALLAYVAAGKNADCLRQYRLLRHWF